MATVYEVSKDGVVYATIGKYLSNSTDLSKIDFAGLTANGFSYEEKEVEDKDV